MNGNGSQRILHVAGIALPVLGVVIGSKLGIGARPAEAAPQVPPAAEVPALPPEHPKLDTTQAAALVYSRSLREQGDFESPFYVVLNATEAAVIESDRPKEATKAEVIPQFHLTSILKGKEPVATINGRLRRKGDLVDAGWLISQIDPQAGTVTLSHAGSEAVTVRLR